MAPINNDEMIHLHSMVPMCQFREATGIPWTVWSLTAGVSVM